MTAASEALTVTLDGFDVPGSSWRVWAATGRGGLTRLSIRSRGPSSRKCLVDGLDALFGTEKVEFDVREGGASLDSFFAELSDYFDGSLTDFHTRIDLSAGTPFQQSVWRQLRRIPYGQTTSYSELARRVGKPGAARAVGNANGRNPLPIVVPCHRVVAAGGGLGGYTGGLDIKRFLLDIERCSVTNDEFLMTK